MNNSNAKLPITLVIPSLASVDDIAEHCDKIKEYLPRVGQIIVVDSSGPDRISFYENRLKEFGAEIYSLPRGLYQSWNYAVSRAHQEYVYFSTIGDYLSPGGLEHLLDMAQKSQADVVISPPRMLAEDGITESPIRWPIHTLVESLVENQCPAIAEGALAIILFSSFMPSSVLGSSASNLYRTRIIQLEPFPDSVGPQGDVIWAFKMCPTFRFAFTKKVCAEFRNNNSVRDRKTQSEASQRVFKLLKEINSTRFDSCKGNGDLNFAKGWSECNLHYFKLSHDYIEWSEQLHDWNERLDAWDKNLNSRENSLIGRLIKYISRLRVSMRTKG